MDPDLQTVADQIADQADEFLAEAVTRAQARALIGERLESDYASVPAADRPKIVAAVMAILEEEEFFGSQVGGATVVDDRKADAE